MKPTAMQRSVDKEGGKIKHSAPPPTPPRHTTTINVSCNGVRSSSSPITSPVESRLSGGFSLMLDSEDGMRRDSNFYISSANVSDAQKKAPPPVSPRDKHGKMPTKSPPPFAVKPAPPLLEAANSQQSHTALMTSPSLKPPPPILPRSNSGGNMASPTGVTFATKTNGHYNDSNDNSGAVNVTETDFFSSLPPLPPDDYIAPLSPPPPNTLPSPTGQKPTVSQSACPPQTPGSDTSTIERKAVSTTINVNNPAAHGPRSVPVPSKPVKNPDPERSRPPPSVLRKPVLSRPPPMTGIAENGAFLGKEKDKDEEEEESFEDGHAAGIPREVFYMNMKPCNGVSLSSGEEPTFAGCRDMKDPRSLHEKQIVSAKGTVRGFKNRVRAGIVTFIEPTSSKFNYKVLEKGKIVVYTTSMTVVRATYDRCKASRNILQNHMVRYEERDLYMSQEHQGELRERLDTDHHILLPQIFIDGLHLGGAADLEKLNESGQLRKLLQTFPKIQVRTMCNSCGGYRFVPCGMCHGSKKSVHRNNFTEEFCALRCMHCNENGLQRCQECIDQQE